MAKFLEMLWSQALCSPCQPTKADVAKHDAEPCSITIGDEGQVLEYLEFPPSSPASCYDEDDNDDVVRMPRSGLIPKRINFCVAQSASQMQWQKGIATSEALRDEDWQRRRQAVERLGWCQLGRHPGDFNKEAAALILPAFRAAIRDEHPEVRATAAFAVGDLGPEAVWYASPVLWEACKDPEHIVRQAAFEVLRANGQETPPERLRIPRLISRSWHDPPALQTVREEPREDCQSECSAMQDWSTTAATEEDSLQSSGFSARDLSSGGTRSFGAASEFTMTISKSFDEQLGLDIDFSQKDYLKVLFVYDGIVSKWNKAQDYGASSGLGMLGTVPYSQAKLSHVEPGDRITQVNGHSGTATELMSMLKNGTWLEVLVQKPDPSQQEHRDVFIV